MGKNLLLLLGIVMVYRLLVGAVAASAAAGQSAQEASTGTSGGLIRRVSWGQISLSAVAGNSDWLGVVVLGRDSIHVGRSVRSHGLFVQRHRVHRVISWQHTVAVVWRTRCWWSGV